MNRTAARPPTERRQVRCAIYCRVSSDERLGTGFDSLDLQRESGEAYVASMKHEGWNAIPERYDDPGFSGGSLERPAFQRLLRDIEAGKVDVLIAYKLDRVTRSIRDFGRIVETLQRHSVELVSVTQRIDTSSAMGRLMVHVLLSFAEFERSIAGERIRDKLAAQRRRGKWAGGTPPLGYDVDRSGPAPRLVVVPAEATRARRAFELYLELGSLLPVVQELNRLGWNNKARRTKTGRATGGRPFDRARLYQLLRNPLYVGRVRHKDQTFVGEHDAIVPEDVFARVQAQLQAHGRGGGFDLKNRYGALLRGLLRCKACDASMTHTFTNRGAKRYRYYACCSAIKKGRASCRTGSLPAAEVERAVVDQVRVIAQDPGLLRDTLRAARAQNEADLGRLAGERRTFERTAARCRDEVARTARETPATSAATARIADLHDQVRAAEARLAELDAESAALRSGLPSDAELKAAFRDFDATWGALSPREQTEVVHLLVARVEFDASDSSIEVAFHPAGITSLAAKAMEDAA